MISGTTRVAAVIGDPVHHSLSPALHNAAFSAAGLDWVYVALPVAAGRGASALEAMRTLGIAGLSVTMPHKTDVAAAVDVLDPAARALQAVNTVVVQDDGRLAGYNTDGAGFVDSLLAAGIDPQGASIVVLGAGGAARAVIDELARRGAQDIAVVNRTVAAALVAAKLAGGIGRIADAGAIHGADIVVNATSLGMGMDPTDETGIACNPASLRAGQVVADLVYHPLQTGLLLAAQRRGATVVDGLGMLVYQAVRQQQLWTGVRPDPVVMRNAAERELATRQR